MNVGRLSGGFPGRSVLFDILKRWTSNALHRDVQDTTPMGCPWQSLQAAMRHSGREVTEKQMRGALVAAYRAMEEWQKVRIAEQKLLDELSFFHVTRYSDKEAVLGHWDWYLYCLTFQSQDFLKEGQLKLLPEATVLRMPLDFVDLHLLAHIFQVQITVHQLQQSAVRFGEGTGEVQLLQYQGLWAPLLGPKILSWDSLCVGDVVELFELPAYLENFSGHSAHVLDYNNEKDYYTVCVAQHIIPVERAHIKRMVTDCRNRGIRRTKKGRPADSAWGAGPGVAAPLYGIPDGEVEFHLLLELLMEKLGTGLQDTKNELDGLPLCEPQPLAEYQEYLENLSPLPDVEVVPFTPKKTRGLPGHRPREAVPKEKRAGAGRRILARGKTLGRADMEDGQKSRTLV
ncbi:unnamed protein product [Effrenium voratum]|nr:unnamed protein product [Effrenium voratum]